MLELTPTLAKRASGLTADGKQKISLGRGLVRSDVNVIMFDEPLTVIDPHLKWQLRSKLKELHQRIQRTMIYVTHDQTEALDLRRSGRRHEQWRSGADRERPSSCSRSPMHTFVGHFIGSPGMNVLPCEVKGGKAYLRRRRRRRGQRQVPPGRPARLNSACARNSSALPRRAFAAEVVNVADVGRFRVVETAPQAICRSNLLVPEGEAIPERQDASRLRSAPHAGL